MVVPLRGFIITSHASTLALYDGVGAAIDLFPLTSRPITLGDGHGFLVRMAALQAGSSTDINPPFQFSLKLTNNPTATRQRRTQGAITMADVPANLEVHFLHSDDPRDGFHVMSTNPLVFYSFRTPVGFLLTHTIVRARPSLLAACVSESLGNVIQVDNASGVTVAMLNWTGLSALGTITWPGTSKSETHMCDLVAPFPSMLE